MEEKDNSKHWVRASIDILNEMENGSKKYFVLNPRIIVAIPEHWKNENKVLLGWSGPAHCSGVHAIDQGEGPGFVWAFFSPPISPEHFLKMPQVFVVRMEICRLMELQCAGTTVGWTELISNRRGPRKLACLSTRTRICFLTLLWKRSLLFLLLLVCMEKSR